MKSMLRLFSITLLVAMLLSACATAATPETITEKVVETQIVEVEVEKISTQIVEVEKDGPVTVGYAAPSLIGGQLDIQSGLVNAAQEKGWQVITTNANGDAQKQNNDIDYFISLGVDAIVAVPQDSAAICAAVEKASAAGIPFYTIDRSPLGCQINMTVLSDNRLGGQQAGQAMVDALIERYGEPKGKVLEITGDLGQNVGQLRRDGFHDVIDEYSDIEVIQKVGDWQADKGQDIVIDVATANPDLDGIYMHSDGVYGPGTQAALTQLNMLFPKGEEGHVIITSVDAAAWMLDAIRAGIADASASQPIYDFGIIVNWIEKELNGEAIEEGVVEKDGALWSPANVKLNADGSFELFLSTVLVTLENVDNPGLWANQGQ